MECNRDTSASTGQLSSASSTGGGMHHSFSTPAGVDGGARTPPTTPKKGGKMLAVRVQMLDDTVTIFQVQAKATGRVLFEQVCKQLHLLEADYFGLEYQDLGGTKYWLDLQKPISRQLGLSLVDPLLYFCVKFYTPDPSQLEEEYTRYLFCLQVKRDLSHGYLQCNDNTAALMASYIVQAECGDHVLEDYPDHTYLSSYKFVPHQDHEMERRIMENHKKHTGQSPAEADLNLLETARRCELYGMKMHPAKDHENVPLNLAVAHMGIVVFQHYTKINTFSWAKIRKISFKRKRFLIKLHPEGYGYYKDIVEFFFEGRNECKNFWKKCVENHGFFRCSSVKTTSRHKTRVLSRGSSFRYSGRTQKQIVEFVRDNYVKRQAFQRSASFRHSSAHSSASNMHNSTVGNSISAHPLLPLADSTLSVEASKLSASVGSMDVVSEIPASPTTKSVSHRHGTATSWSSVPDTRPTIPYVQTTTSPSPPQTTQSASPATSATMSPQHIQFEDQKQDSHNRNLPVAVLAAVHRDDTGTMRIHTTTARMPSSHKSESKLDQPTPVLTNNYPLQTQSQNDLDTQNSSQYTYKSIAPPTKRKIWQRSSSCRELYDYSFEESGRAKRVVTAAKKNVEKSYINLEERTLESPITKYDSRHVVYNGARQSSLEMHQDIMIPDHKVYSSSYPGTTSYSQESMEDPGNYDLRDSQDDLSHDSYELLERSDDDFSLSGEYKYQQKKSLNARSCSLDSGNYLPSDADSDAEHKHKCRSISDLQNNVFTIDDPRDYPREKIPRKSDGSYYKALKINSRASSLESRSDYYDAKVTKTSRKSSRETSFGSRTSSQESKSDYESKIIIRKNRSLESLGKKFEGVESRTSSLDSRSSYFDTTSKIEDIKLGKFPYEYDRKIPFERNYGIQKTTFNNVDSLDHTVPSGNIFKEVSHVHSVSLQNVETDNLRNTNLQQSENGRIKSLIETKVKSQKSTESESNIFSFDEDRIQSLQESDMEVCGNHTNGNSVANDATTKAFEVKKEPFRDVFIEIEPKRLEKGRDAFPLHQPIERTKSDPNSLARQRLNSSARRHLLMHQKSIDLTPAESSDDDYLYRQIPSAPPITKYRGSHFEMPTAEFGHFDILKREIEGQKTKFEVPKSQFEILGAKTQSDLINPPPKNDIPYTLHKRHVMNGTATKEETVKYKEASKQAQINDELNINVVKPKSPIVIEPEQSSFLFTQNIDLSKVDPVTLEVDKTKMPIQHMSSPKRDITRIDPALLETLNSKLSQIESDSPTSSKTESLKPDLKLKPQKLLADFKVEKIKPRIEIGIQKNGQKSKVLIDKIDIKPLIKEKVKTDVKPKRGTKTRSHLNKKGIKSGGKAKVRITSFSSDDESLDSDDVFGSAEATPTKLEFSPPQTRKEMESILKYEAERKYLQYTMSSTEVEGSPPQTRKTETLQYDRSLDPNYQTELRRISERSISIPSSEDDLNIATSDMQPVFNETVSEPGLATVPEIDKEHLDKTPDETASEDVDADDKIKLIEEAVLLQELPKQSEINVHEKALLISDIEHDLQDLKVPPKTKITEICSPSARRKGQSPVLFAHARLNLSEGSAMTMLQKQQATESPLPGRRAKSLDTPVISVSRLPPLNSFSSKDDTVEEEQQTQAKEVKEPTISDGDIKKHPLAVEKSKDKHVSSKPLKEKSQNKPELKPKPKPKEKDQIVPDVISRSRKPIKSSATRIQKHDVKVRPSSKRPPIGDTKDKPKPPPHKATTKVTVQSSTQQSQSTVSVKTEVVKEPEEIEIEKVSEPKSLPTQLSVAVPDVKEIKRAKSQELESTKRTIPKEKAKSLEKLEFKRASSRDRIKSQEDSDTDIAKRQEKQQMLYEIAIQQTKTIKSPIKDVLPVFPQVEESVRERHGKLEISINTIENSNVSLEEAIIITKSPKRLDKKMDKKLTKSLELNVGDRDSDDESAKVVQRLGKSLDLENRPKSEETNFEFDFQMPTNGGDSKESDEKIVKELVEAEVHEQPVEEAQVGEDEKITLEGTSLDIWLSLEDKDKLKSDKEKMIVIQKSQDFFEQRSKPPDLSKLETKSSSDSQSLEKVSLGNSLDIKYIDDSGDSSHKSEKDAQLISDLQKATDTVGKFISKKLRRREAGNILEKQEKALLRITSEDESLTEVSDLKCEFDANLLSIQEIPKDALLRLSVERSRSEDTGSWMTVECDEYIGTADSFEIECAPLDSPEKISREIPPQIDELQTPTNKEQVLDSHPVIVESNQQDLSLTLEIEDTSNVIIKETLENTNLLTTTEIRKSKIDLLKRSSDQSRSSDTTGSWTSVEKDLSPGNPKETGDESSVSCTMGQAIGLSQTIEIFATRELLDKESPDIEVPRSPRSPRICVLGRTFTIDEESPHARRRSDESSSDEANEIPNDIMPINEVDELNSEECAESGGVKYKKTRYPFEEKWSSDSELGQRIHQKIAKKLSSADKSLSSLDESYSDKRGRNGKRSLLGVEKLSAESRSSLDTESSSGSLGLAARMQKTGELPPQEASSTWRPFLLESSGSSSLEEGILPQDQDLEKEYFVTGFKVDADVTPTKENISNNDTIADFCSNFGYPCLGSSVGGIGMGISSVDMLANYNASFLGRTLSRISERSTNSEKSSLDEDSTKASTQLDSLNDESLASSDHQASISSDTPSHARLSDSEKKLSNNNGAAEKKKELKTSEKFNSEHISNINNLLLQRQISDDRRTSAEMAELSIDDIEIITSESGLRLRRQDSDDTVIDEEWVDPEMKKDKKGSSSQESEDWPLPDIPQHSDYKSLLALHETGSSDASQITTQVLKTPEAVIPKVFGLRGSLKSQDSEPWPSPPSSIQEAPIIGNVETHYITPAEEPCKVTVESSTVSTYDNDSNSDYENQTLDLGMDKSHTASDPTYENVAPDQTEPVSEAFSESLSAGPSGVKIVLENKSGSSSNSNSEEDLNISNLNDDVFVEVTETSRNELRPPTALRRSTNSDDSSHSGHKKELGSTSKKGSHSSYSEEECTSSMGTNLEDGTVRLALKPTRCTHSSHSEDTSIALSLSEWSNSTNTVKFQNLSTSNSGATKSSTSGLKSDDNSLADIAQSISEWSSSNSNTLKGQNSSLQFQKLSSSASTGDSSTLTEFIPTISERSSSETSKTLIPQQYFNVRKSISRLGSSIDDLDVPYDQKNLKSPQNIPSEDLAIVSTVSIKKFDEHKIFTKSTERPVVIPVQLLSDTEKSTGSSSLEQKTERPRFQKHQISSKSADQPAKVPLSKCSAYYSSSLSSESTPVPSSKSITANKTATVPLTRNHRKPISKSLFQAKSPPSENDSTSSMESPKSTPDSRDRRGYRRRRQVPQKRYKVDRERHVKEEYFHGKQEPPVSEYSNYICVHNIEELASALQYETEFNEDSVILQSVYSETLEEGYFPDGDSQSGSDIFRMEREEDQPNERFELAEGFDISSIPPPLLEDDFEDNRPPEI